AVVDPVTRPNHWNDSSSYVSKVTTMSAVPAPPSPCKVIGSRPHTPQSLVNTRSEASPPSKRMGGHSIPESGVAVGAKVGGGTEGTGDWAATGSDSRPATSAE